MEILKILIEKKDLSAEQISTFIKDVEKGRISALQQAAILGGLNVKGITAKELAGFVQAFATKIQPFPATSGVHLIGAEGSLVPTAFILSGIGVPVVHQVPYSSQRGAEFPLSRDGEKNKKIFDQLRISFPPTQKLHPVLEKWKTIGRQMKIRTIADLALPLLQAAPAHLNIMHASSKEEMLLLVEAAKNLKIKQALVLYIPEHTPFKLFATELRNGKMKTHTISEKSFGIVLEKASESSQDFYQNFLQQKPFQLVLISSSLALVFSGHVSTLKKAYQLANNFVLSGKANDHFLAYKKAVTIPALFLSITEWKQKEIFRKKKNISLKKLIRKTKVSDRDFKKNLLSRRPSLITEISSTALRSSAKFLEQGRVQALSIAADEKFLKGSLSHLTKARQLLKEIPLLCKDFIIDEYQIYEARRFGADAIVLMISFLNRDQVRHFLRRCVKCEAMMIWRWPWKMKLKLSLLIRRILTKLCDG
jgi:anthranilate phosphoribosyltransferase